MRVPAPSPVPRSSRHLRVLSKRIGGFARRGLASGPIATDEPADRQDRDVDAETAPAPNQRHPVPVRHGSAPPGATPHQHRHRHPKADATHIEHCLRRGVEPRSHSGARRNDEADQERDDGDGPECPSSVRRDRHVYDCTTTPNRENGLSSCVPPRPLPGRRSPPIGGRPTRMGRWTAPASGHLRMQSTKLCLLTSSDLSSSTPCRRLPVDGALELCLGHRRSARDVLRARLVVELVAGATAFTAARPQSASASRREVVDR